MAEPTRDEQVVAQLSAPFPENEIRWVPKGGGREVAYVTARHGMNRLDEAVGPAFWSDHYEIFGQDGVLCRLTVSFDGGSTWVTKCGIGGYAGMQDAEDDEKSAESSAFKRAAVKFGIGRYLYGNGVPEFCGDCPMPDRSRGVKVPAPRPAAPAQAPRQETRTAPQQQRYTGGGGSRYDNYKIPPPGKAVFAWAKQMGEAYGVDLIGGMRKAGEALDVGTNFTAWGQAAVDQICLRTIRYIKSLENYDGKFDKINTDAEGDEDGDDTPF